MTRLKKQGFSDITVAEDDCGMTGCSNNALWIMFGPQGNINLMKIELRRKNKQTNVTKQNRYSYWRSNYHQRKSIPGSVHYLLTTLYSPKSSQQ